MDLNQLVDFETFYFYSLLENIKQKGSSKLDESLRSDLSDFVEFLMSGSSPLDSIEKLARRQGTSDISIFFSDIIERINENNPEKYMGKIDEYAHDFLEMFRELTRDPQWHEIASQDLTEVIQDTSGPSEPEVSEEPEIPAESTPELPGVNLLTFVHSHLEQQMRTSFKDEDPSLISSLNRLFENIENGLPSTDFLKQFRSVEKLQTAVGLMEKLYSPPADPDELENYLEDFWRDCDSAVRELEMIASDYPEEFQQFCDGSYPAGQEVEKEQERETEEIFESIPETGEVEAEETGLSEEEQNLRFLLRDYLTNEIEMLGTEVINHLKRRTGNPQDQEAESVVLENLKVLKDLGQIHKYPRIEWAGAEVLSDLRKSFAEKKPLTDRLPASLEKLFAAFRDYIDAVLNQNPESAIENINELTAEISRLLVSAEVTAAALSLQERDQLGPVFLDVNERILKRLESNLSEAASGLSDENLRMEMKDDLMHLHYWYGVWKISGAQNILELLRNWLSNPGQYEKFQKRSNQIRSLFSVLSTELFTTKQEKWTEILESLTVAPKPIDGVRVEKSEPAFRDVTVRHLEGIIDIIEREDLDYTRLGSSVADYLDQIEHNSRLVEWDELSRLCSETASSLRNMPEPREQQLPEMRKRLSGLFHDMVKTVRRLPEKADLTPNMESIRTFFSDFAGREQEDTNQEESAAEEGQPEREEENDQDFREAYRDETSRYLEELENHLKILDEDRENSGALQGIGNTLHTIVGAARVMEQQEMVDIAGPMEHLAELILDGKVKLRKNFVSLGKRALKALRKSLEGKKTSADKLQSSINSYLTKYHIQKPVSEEPEGEQTISPESSFAEEKPLEEIPAEGITSEEKSVKSGAQEQVVQLQESDPELLEIFRNETDNNLETLENSLNLVEKFRYDKETLQVMDHAVHEIRSAAKMLGFTEIGDLMDSCEELIELINRNEPENWKEIIPVFRKSIQVIRDISKDSQVSKQLYDETMASLKKFVEDLQGGPVPREEKTVETGAVTAEDLKQPHSDVMLQTFLQEGREYIEDMNFVLMKLEKDAANKELIEQLMRTLHTLKGSSSMMFEEKMEQLLHDGEELVERVYEKTGKLSADIFDQIFAVVDEVDYMLNSLASEGSSRSKNCEEILQGLQAGIVKYGGSPREESVQKDKEEPLPVISEEPPQSGSSTPPEILSRKPGDAHVRMHVKQVDSLLNEAAELVIYHNQFKTQVNRFKGYVPRLDLEGKNLQNILWHLEKLVDRQQRLLEQLEKGETGPDSVLEDSQKVNYQNLRELTESLQRFHNNFNQALQGIKSSGKLYEEQLQKITRLSNSIHDEIIKARLVPIGLLFQRFQRPLRDLARKYGKKIRLQIEGENTELDRILADELYEPMLHILRNALDHGIEIPEERKQAGKAEEGLIRVSAEQDRNYVIITIEDDGRGINSSDVREQVVERKLLNAEEAGKLTATELFEYLMMPGFSTAKKKGVLSGRGVGLDVVKNQIQKIKGDVRIYSTPQQNTRFIIRVPYSITVTQAMLVELDSNMYAIPLLQVEETVNISDDKLLLREDGYYLSIGGGEIPVIPLSSILNLEEKSSRQLTHMSHHPVIIVQDEGRKAALLVDNILHREEILIKSLGEMLQTVRYIMGGSILADGQVVLVVDVPQIVFNTFRTREKNLNLQPQDFKPAEKHRTASASEKTQKKSVVDGRKARVLIVDDSLSIRKFLTGLLTKQNYEVEVARNGQSAIELLSQNEFDAVITDLEMPQLSGYDLIEHIRSDKRWDNLPVIVLTGRAGKNIEQQTRKLGADDFVVKPFKETELLNKLEKFIEVK